jgi:hypothetical protein
LAPFWPSLWYALSCAMSNLYSVAEPQAWGLGANDVATAVPPPLALGELSLSLCVLCVFCISEGVVLFRRERRKARGLFAVRACVCRVWSSGRLTCSSIQFGPSVGSKALTLGQAIMLAFVVECAGAVITGRDVVGTLAASHDRPCPLARVSLSLPPPRARHATPKIRIEGGVLH